MLFLSWPQARGTEDADLKGEEIFDQIATASENVAHAASYQNADSNNLEEQLPSAPSASAEEASAVHYENSNGFVPMIPSASPSHDDSLETDDSEQQDPSESEESDATIAVSAQGGSETQAEKKFEEDLAYSSEARIFLNADPGSLTKRRSFDFQEGRLNEFELLKVKNDTPAVANYQEFYENVRGRVNTEADSEPDDAPSSGRTSGGTRTESYAQNYVRQSQQVSEEEDPYAQYYSYNNVQDTKKTTYEQEKVADNYPPQDTANHDSEQSVAAPASSSRTNYEVNELASGGTYDNIAEQSRARHRFSSKPVVVAESNDYKADFSNQVRNGVSDSLDQRNSRNLESSSSNESAEYSSEYIERPRIRAQKSRRRPAYPDTSRKLLKEHRGTTEESAEEDKQKYNPARLKSQRFKTNPWLNDPSANHQEETSAEDTKHTKSARTRGSKSKHNSWSQVSPNLEISHSNGIELDNTSGKPKYVVNLVPVGNFDHATALGNSQGFDMSNAMLQNIVTAAPILSTPHSVFAPGLTLSKGLMSTPVPDVIVGQNSFQNPVHTVLVSGGQNGKDGALRATYLPSTITPVFAVTSGLNPTLQNVRMQNNVTPRTTAFAVTPAPTTSVVQQMPIGPGVQQLFVPQPTVQTYSNFLPTPLQNSEYQIQVSPHGLQGQNLIGHGNLLSTAPSALLHAGSTMPESRINVVSADSQNKKNAYTVSGTNILATASMAVGQNDQKTGNSYYLQNHNSKDVEMTPRTKTYVQATQVVPTQYFKLQGGNNMDDAVQQQLQINKQLVRNNKLTGIDSAGSHSNNVNAVNALAIASGHAHLPNVITKSVEIVNPNIKPGTIDSMNAYYPTAVLTTPIPIFSTVSSSVTQPTLQNYVNSLTESGTKAKQLGTVDLKTSQNQDRPMFNPINFVPNIDILKNQNALNSKPSTNELLQQGLNLVPVMPGGNFFRPSLAAQSELVTKPKLTSDLQKYAEEMFKESLKTMYNSQKWNNDRKPSGGQSGSENDIAKLRLELQKLRASLSGDSRFRDILDASESNVHTTDPPKSSDKKKDPLLATLEQLLKTKPRGPIHIYHGVTRPGRKRKPGEPNFNSDFHDDFASESHAMEFLTPPRSQFHSKSPPYHEKLKKRPGSSRYKNGSRKPIRPSNSPPRIRIPELDASASTINIHLPDDDPPFNKMPFEHDTLELDSRHQASFHAYPTFTTSSPETLGSVLREIKTPRSKDYDINHPRMHNLLGLLMKNKQLPTRSTQNYLRNKDQLRQYFESEKHRLQQQYYEDTLRDTMRDYLERSEVAARPRPVVNRHIYINGTA